MGFASFLGYGACSRRGSLDYPFEDCHSYCDSVFHLVQNYRSLAIGDFGG